MRQLENRVSRRRSRGKTRPKEAFVARVVAVAVAGRALVVPSVVASVAGASKHRELGFLVDRWSGFCRGCDHDANEICFGGDYRVNDCDDGGLCRGICVKKRI